MQTRSAKDFDALRAPARGYELPQDVGRVDWKTSVPGLLNVVDGLLQCHGLQIVMYDTLSDAYAFVIEPRRGVGRAISLDELRRITVGAALKLTDVEGDGMTVAGLVARLQMLPAGAVVKIFDADSRQFEPVTGVLFGGDEDVVELHSDDIT